MEARELQIATIGEFSATLEKAKLPIRDWRPKVRGVLAVLALLAGESPNRTAEIEAIGDAVWGEGEWNRKTFNTTLSQLRTRLGDVGRNKRLVITDGPNLVLSASVDYDEFTVAYQRGQYEEALRIAGVGDYSLLADLSLRDVESHWLDPVRTGFHEKVDVCLLESVEYAVSAGNVTTAIKRMILRRDLARRQNDLALVADIDERIKAIRSPTEVWAGPNAHSTREKPPDSIRATTNSYLNAASSKLAHLQAANIPYIDVSCVIRTSNGFPEIPLRDALTDWLANDDSNVALISGEFGAGKTSALVDFVERQLDDESRQREPLFVDFKALAAESPQAPNPIETLVNRLVGTSNNALRSSGPRSVNLSDVVIVIDAFDGLNLFGGPQLPKPDLRYLSPVLTPDSKVLIACRRSSLVASDELARQLSEPGRRASLGAREPWNLELRSLELAHLKGFSTQLDAVLARFERFHHHGAQLFRRPLFLQMILASGPALLSASPVIDDITVGELFQRYVNTVLYRDFDRGESRIPGDVKRAVLVGVAADIYGQPVMESSGITNRDQIGADLEKVNLRVMEAVTSDAALVAGGSSASGYQWTADFSATNSLLVDAGTRSPAGSRFQFVQDSFFEFFLAQHFVARIRSGESFGVDDTGHYAYQPLFDSLLLYFISFFLDEQSRSKLRRLASRDDISHADRLLAIYLSESSPEIIDLLGSAGAAYREFLESHEHSGASHFLRKMVKYQLILLDRDVDLAFQYVEYLKALEKDEDLELESSLASLGGSPTTSLLGRLIAPHLEVARPITVFRLSQFGDESAIPVLRTALDAEDDPRLVSLIEEAIETVSNRALEANSVVS